MKRFDRKDINTFLREKIIPWFRKIGFKGSLPYLRRITDCTVDLVTFQFDRNGGGFVIELAQTKNEVFKTYWGKEILQSKLTAYDLNNRTRIHPKGILKDSLTDDWFRFDKGGLFTDPLKKIEKDIENNMETIENYFKIAEWGWLPHFLPQLTEFSRIRYASSKLTCFAS